MIWETFGWMAVALFAAVFGFAIYIALTSRRD